MAFVVRRHVSRRLYRATFLMVMISLLGLPSPQQPKQQQHVRVEAFSVSRTTTVPHSIHQNTLPKRTTTTTTPARPVPVARMFATFHSSCETEEPNNHNHDDDASLVAVHKNKNNMPSFVCFGVLCSWIGSTTSISVSFAFFVILALRRDAFMVALFLASMANGMLSKILKMVWNQERPEMTNARSSKNGSTSTIDGTGASSAMMAPTDKGMPSSHAMSLGFLGTVVAMMTLQQQQQQGPYSLVWASWYPYNTVVGLLFMCFYISMSLYHRFQTQLHTKSQLLVGLGLGSFNGLLYRMVLQDWLVEWVYTNGTNWGLFHANKFPVGLLVIPACVGAVVVGSVERRLSLWLRLGLLRKDTAAASTTRQKAQ